MQLNEILGQIQQQMATALPAELLVEFGASLSQLQESDAGKTALEVGNKAPNFSLQNHEGQSVELSALLVKGPVIINFIRGSWCPFCMAELSQYQSLLADESETNRFKGTILFITPQLIEKSEAMLSDSAHNLLVLSDPQNSVARMFGLLFTLDEKSQDSYASIGINLAKLNGDESYELPIPATYVVDTSQHISYRFVDVNYMVRAEPKEILKLVK